MKRLAIRMTRFGGTESEAQSERHGARGTEREARSERHGARDTVCLIFPCFIHLLTHKVARGSERTRRSGELEEAAGAEKRGRWKRRARRSGGGGSGERGEAGGQLSGEASSS
jgi:hypothetical protein